MGNECLKQQEPIGEENVPLVDDDPVTLDTPDLQAAFYFGVKHAGRSMATILNTLQARDVACFALLRQQLRNPSLEPPGINQPLVRQRVIEIMKSTHDPSNLDLPRLASAGEATAANAIATQWKDEYCRGAQSAIYVISSDDGEDPKLWIPSLIGACAAEGGAENVDIRIDPSTLDLSTVYGIIISQVEAITRMLPQIPPSADVADPWYHKQARLIMALDSATRLVSGCSDHMPRGSLMRSSQIRTSLRTAITEAERNALHPSIEQTQAINGGG